MEIVEAAGEAAAAQPAETTATAAPSGTAAPRAAKSPRAKAAPRAAAAMAAPSQAAQGGADRNGALTTDRGESCEVDSPLQQVVLTVKNTFFEVEYAQMPTGSRPRSAPPTRRTSATVACAGALNKEGLAPPRPLLAPFASRPIFGLGWW